VVGFICCAFEDGRLSWGVGRVLFLQSRIVGLRKGSGSRCALVLLGCDMFWDFWRSSGNGSCSTRSALALLGHETRFEVALHGCRML
jgi:hypothetical protein